MRQKFLKFLSARTCACILGTLFSLQCPIGSTQVLTQISDSTAKTDSQETDPLSMASITIRLHDAEAELQQLEMDNLATGAPSSVEHRLRRITQLLGQQKSAAEELTSTADSPTNVEVTTDNATILKLNALYESLDSAEASTANHTKLVQLATEKLTDAKKELSSLKTEEGVKPGNTTKSMSQARAMAILSVRLAQEEVYLAKLESRLANRTSTSEEALEQAIKNTRQQLTGHPDTVEDAFDQISSQLRKISRLKDTAKISLETVQFQLAGAQQRYSSTTGAKADMNEIRVLASLKDVLQERIALYEDERERLENQRNVWQSWSTVVAGSASRQELRDWLALNERRIEAHQRDLSHMERLSSDLGLRVDSAQSKLGNGEFDIPLAHLQEERLQQLTILQTDVSSALRRLEFDHRVMLRLSKDINTSIGGFNFIEWVKNAIEAVIGLWNYEITTIEDAPFTLGSLTIGLILFGTGIVVSRRVSALVERIARNRLGLDPGASHAIQVLSFYIMLIGIGLLALRTIHFPLTAFAFLGGALAIGIGFGSQNVMNNFISGLILMLERPVRAADVVEVDGNYGAIEKIGARSTQIRSNDGRHIVVPNSFFLESNVVNWTLSDELIRAKVAVGVAYGSPTKLVASLIEKVARTHPSILKEPKPILLFESFGDNSLNFEIHFWVTARSPMSVRTVESAVRFEIDDVFREHNITIAFPQRDVHLDLLSPLEIRMLPKQSAMDS